jgi:AraC-like DNA-binding protein
MSPPRRQRPRRPPIQVDLWGDRLLLPELKHLGWDVLKRAWPEDLREHQHSQGWEICYLASGQVEWWVEEEVHRVGARHCYVTRPGERHGGVDRVMHACEIFWVQVVLPPQAPLPGIERALGDGFGRAFAGMRQRAFPAPPEICTAFERLLEEHRAPDAHSVAAARGALHLLLASVARCVARQAQEPAPSAPILRAIELLALHLDRAPAIADVARAVGLGTSRFHERFLAEAGATPLEFLTRRRIEEAQRLLRAGSPVAEVAAAVGFTREHFTTIFRRLVGLSPAAWRDRTQ